MKEIQNIDCPCSDSKEVSEKTHIRKTPHILYKIILIAAGVLFWFLIYRQLYSFSSFLTFNILSLQQGSHLGEAVHFFLYDTPKVLMLLSLVIFGV